MSRVYYFSAGPAVLPEEVLREAASEMLDGDGKFDASDWQNLISIVRGFISIKKFSNDLKEVTGSHPSNGGDDTPPPSRKSGSK